ncbi:MAG TPA: CHASE2 domain-containing protein [Steroidobacteraceae bacterium]|nr:CHASE2 domain-containing protein [Steroidobacteraceae bacterium]
MDSVDWWLRPIAWLFARRPDLRDRSGRGLLRLGNRFYVLLAIVMALVGAWDQFVKPFSRQLSRDNFDWLMTHRPIPYRPSTAIVVLDIDEASLAALAPEYGRWPWPRQVLASVASRVEAAGAQAVMFDILFADPDVANPAGDAAFDRYVAGSSNSFYPVARLNPLTDTQSKVPVSMLNFAEPDPHAGQALNPGRTIALIPPHFASIYDSTRMGTHNIHPDADNVVRWYDNYESLAGYRIPSLPDRMARALHWPRQRQARSLINWPRGVAPYTTISYVDAFRAAGRNDAAYFSRFAGKVVLIGSTAPSLNDIKATPIDSMHPGIYVLATALDNTSRDRFLRPVRPLWIWILEVAMLAASARLFVRATRVTAVTRYFFIVPSSLLLISLLSVSVSDRLVDLSLPAALVLLYFAIAKTFETQLHAFVSGGGVFAATRREQHEGQLQIACLPGTVSKDTVRGLQLRADACPIKVWEPVKSGLGVTWAAQGWILWRWHVPGSDPGPEPQPPLAWRNADPAPPAGDPFDLAHVIAAAAQSAWQAPEPRPSPEHT